MEIQSPTFSSSWHIIDICLSTSIEVSLVCYLQVAAQQIICDHILCRRVTVAYR